LKVAEDKVGVEGAKILEVIRHKVSYIFGQVTVTQDVPETQPVVKKQSTADDKYWSTRCQCPSNETWPGEFFPSSLKFSIWIPRSNGTIKIPVGRAAAASAIAAPVSQTERRVTALQTARSTKVTVTV